MSNIRRFRARDTATANPLLINQIAAVLKKNPIGKNLIYATEGSHGTLIIEPLPHPDTARTLKNEIIIVDGRDGTRYDIRGDNGTSRRNGSGRRRSGRRRDGIAFIGIHKDALNGIDNLGLTGRLETVDNEDI